jgi:hypothetical protein
MLGSIMKPTPPPAARRRCPAVPPPQPAQPFHAFIAYADLPAARRAMGVINEVLEATAGKFTLKPMLWRFDQLASAKWCDYALTDAREAAVVVLASSRPGSLPVALEQWIGALIHHQRGQRVTVISLQGEHDAWTITIEAPAAPAEIQAMPVPLTAQAA